MMMHTRYFNGVGEIWSSSLSGPSVTVVVSHQSEFQMPYIEGRKLPGIY